tara:strand:+ start:219 stop:344 length:126 start_codon:yes stop_codon:yes gene_type:complete
MTRLAILFAALLAGCFEPSTSVYDPCHGLGLGHDVFEPVGC